METLTIIPTKVTAIKSGHGNNGDWTLYEVEAIGTDQQQITDRLKSFEQFQIHKEIEVDAEREDDETYGTSYMLRSVAKGGLARQVDKLRERVQKLEAEVDWLKSGGRPVVSSGLEADDEPALEPAPASHVSTSTPPSPTVRM